MTNKKLLLTIALGALALSPMAAQTLTIKGVYNQGRDNNGELTSTYVGWNYDLAKAIFVVPQGIYRMEWDGTTLTTPVKDPAVNIADFYSGGQYTDNEKASWANDFNLMSGNSGAVMANGVITTVFSRTDDQTSEDGSDRFSVRKWDAQTGKLLSNKNYPESACLESAGMCLNPKDGKVYGLFYLTAQQLPEDIISDPDFFVDTEGDATDTDAGYCICSIDLETMAITPITPGLYYYNFVAFAINADGRAFAITSGGTAGLEGEDGKVYDTSGNLTGAQLCEFDLASGVMMTVPELAVDPETGESYVEQVNKYPALGYCSQYKRQSACFSNTNPNKLYWNGYFNSGKGYNEWGSWGNLPDSEWKTNGKYDTSLYEIDITTGECTRLANINNRYSFSCIWDIEEVADTDLTGDGVWDIADLNVVLNTMLGKDGNNKADLTGDGAIGVDDVNIAINNMLNK